MTSTVTPPTQSDIRARFDSYTSTNDFFGFRREALVDAMEFETASDLVEEDVTADDWDEPDVMATASDYLEFAIDKAHNHRGISASRSIQKLEEWLWCLGDQQLLARFIESPYHQYGVPKLAVLVDAWGVDHDYFKTDAWRRMTDGLACDPDGCMEGCGL